MAFQSYFPTLIYQKKIQRAESKLNHSLLEECYKIKDIDRAGLRWCKKNYKGGFTSYASMNKLYDFSPHFAQLKAVIDKQKNLFVEKLEMDVRPRNVQMCSMWINIMPRGVAHTMHIHPHSIISGSYYLQVPKGTSGLKIEDPRMGYYMVTPPRKSNCRIENKWFVEISPSVGEIIMFESWLRHEVVPQPQKFERISISFNYN